MSNKAPEGGTMKSLALLSVLLLASVAGPKLGNGKAQPLR